VQELLQSDLSISIKIYRGGTVSSNNKSLLDVATQKIVESQVWRSIFRHGYPDTPLNQSLVMMSNVFLHLHPVKVSRQAMRITYTWCMGGISFFPVFASHHHWRLFDVLLCS